MGRYGGVFLLQGGEFQRPWKRCSMVANRGLEIEIAMGTVPMPISVSRPRFALRYEVPKFLARGGHLCMAVLTIAIAPVCTPRPRGGGAAAGRARSPARPPGRRDDRGGWSVGRSEVERRGRPQPRQRGEEA